ncbi:RNA polymerase sigma factor [Sunxiuqinia indica]|uniref:RNA polymerase sigma factor n=1 Tax=Sunxiuqinia indica TaxID=2692584 RepID=UPI001358A844|nr:sigma-70 family RNA polymerase sigma factor [Sunxiuqinia indica]
MDDNYQKIWESFLKGDDAALSTIYFDFFDLLLNFGMKYATDRYLVEDCIQNLFIDLLKNRGKQRSVENIKFYLMKALRNQISNEQRKAKRMFSTDNLGETEFRINYSIENRLIADETEKIKSKFLTMVKQSLTSRQQEVLYLKFTCGFDYPQISDLMQISVESVRTIVYRTLKTIKDTFGTENYSSLIFATIFRSFFA